MAKTLESEWKAWSKENLTLSANSQAETEDLFGEISDDDDDDVPPEAPELTAYTTFKENLVDVPFPDSVIQVGPGEQLTAMLERSWDFMSDADSQFIFANPVGLYLKYFYLLCLHMYAIMKVISICRCRSLKHLDIQL